MTSFKPDVIYTNTSVVRIGYLFSKKFHIPHVWLIREFVGIVYDFIYIPFRNNIKK